MKSIIFKSLFLILGIVAVLSISSCIKEDFDAPPTTGSDPEISADQIVSLNEVFAKYVPGAYTPIALDKYLKAVVVADDRSGNFYKTLILEDENSDFGIAVLIDENEIHSQYAVGRRVFLKLNDLTISDYNGLPQIGMGVDNSGTSPRLGYIPSALLPDVMIKGQTGVPVVPKVKTISELGPNDLNTLIKLEGVQFRTVGPTVTYADNNPTSPVTINQTLVDCANNQIIVRNSGYAEFAGDILPEKNGSLTAVYSVFRQDKQLFIRETTDIVFDKDRCGQSGSDTRISVQALRALYTGTPSTISSGFAQGIVISDIANKNINERNMIVQDGEFGILFRFKSAISVPLGSEVKVGLIGGSLSEFNNILQVQNLENTNVEVIATGKSVTPKTMTVSQIDNSIHESTLIKIENATLIGGAKLSDNNVKVKDATGEIALFTFATSTFGAQTLPSGNVTITAIVSDFTSGTQLSLRNSGDITGGGPCDVNVATADCDGDGVANAQDCEPQNAAIYPGGPCDDGNAATFNDNYDDQCVCKGGSSSAEFNNVQELRALFTGNPKTINNGFVTGIVISDYTQKNINGNNLVIQEGGYGIVLRFKDPVSIPLGTEIKVNLTGGSLSEFNELLQVQNLLNVDIQTLSTNNTVIPKVLKVSELAERYESTLVKIENATIIDGTKFSDKLKVTDNTGGVLLFTNAAATFYNSTVKSGTVSVTAIAGQFKEDLQLLVRSANDIQ